MKMFESGILNNPDDFFLDLKSRGGNRAFFYRVESYSAQTESLVKKFQEAALKNGIVIEGGIPNPDQKNLSYYTETMGTEFSLNLDFIDSALKKWLPRLKDTHSLAWSILSVLQDLLKAGKNESILKNIYVKFMCWLYYKFERIANSLGSEEIPKILYEGNVSGHELLLLSVLSRCGADILLLQTSGGGNYLKLDPDSSISRSLPVQGGTAFPQGFSLRALRDSCREEEDFVRLAGPEPDFIMCTNAWIEDQKYLEVVGEPVLARGKREGFSYNAFMRINGAEDKIVYADQIHRLCLGLRNSKRGFVTVSGRIPVPEPEEINCIRRENYGTARQLIIHISQNISFPNAPELQKAMRHSFVRTILDAEKKGPGISRLTSKAVYILCWLRRYSEKIFGGWKKGAVGAFIYLGGCRNDNEADFLRFLSRLPVDVLILCPNLNEKCCLEDHLLYEENYGNSVNVTKFIDDTEIVSMQTTGASAKDELDSLLYSNGLYRQNQYSKAVSVCLRPIYEEIIRFWDLELKIRQFFKVNDGVVSMPVFFSKICGVENGDTAKYWNTIRSLNTEETVLIPQIPYIKAGEPNEFKSLAVDFFKNGKLQRQKIKNHPKYPYAILREEMQDHLLDKIELLLSQGLIKGIGENGTEYAVIGWCLKLPKEILRRIQSFDFTKKNPKLIFLCTGETTLSLEDSVLTAFLNLVGFDILFFVPTGYQCVEKHFAKKIMEEHQCGVYQYDLKVPDLSLPSLEKTGNRILNRIFGKR